MRAAAAMLPAVSFASKGDTSIDTQPSTPSVASKAGRNRSAARRRSSSASSMNKRFAGFSRLGLVANAFVVGGGIADRLVENGRVRGQSGDRELVDVTAQRAVVENLAGDVVQPEALAEVVQLLGLVHVRSWFVAATRYGRSGEKIG